MLSMYSMSSMSFHAIPRKEVFPAGAEENSLQNQEQGNRKRKQGWKCRLGWHPKKPIVRAWRPGPPPANSRGLVRFRPAARVWFHMGDQCRACGKRWRRRPPQELRGRSRRGPETVSERFDNGSFLSEPMETKA